MAWIVNRTRRDGRAVAHVQWRDGQGKIHSRSLGTADQLLVEMERRLVEEREEGKEGTGRITDDADEALKRFLTYASLSCSAETRIYYAEKLGRIFRWFGRTPMRSWDRALFERFIAAHTAPIPAEQAGAAPGRGQVGVRRRPWSARTVRMHVVVSRRFISWARDSDVLCPDFIGRFKPPMAHRSPPRFLTKAQLLGLLEVSRGSPLEPAIALSGLAGLRRNEWAQLQASSVDWAERRICVPGPKSHRDRWVEMCPQLEEILKRHRPTAGPIVRFDPKSYGAYSAFHRLCEKVKIPRCGWHALRHTFATLLVQAGSRITSVRDLLGHADISTTSLYAHSSDEDRREDMKRTFG